MLEITKEFVLSKVDTNDITDIDRYTELCKELQEFLDSDDFIDDFYSDSDYMHMQSLGDYDKTMCEDNIIFSMCDFCSYCDEHYDAFEIIERCTTHDLFDKHDCLFIDTNYGEIITGNGLNDFDINMNDIVVRIIEDPIPFVWDTDSFEYNNNKITEIKEKMKECVRSI